MITLLRYTYAPSGHDEAPVYYNFGNISLTNNIRFRIHQSLLASRSTKAHHLALDEYNTYMYLTALDHMYRPKPRYAPLTTFTSRMLRRDRFQPARVRVLQAAKGYTS